LTDIKLFLVPAFCQRLWAHSDNFQKANLLQAFIEHKANCPSLRDFRDGYTIHINHAIGTNIINFAAIGYTAGCLNMEDEVLNGDVPVDSQRYLVKQFLRLVREHVVHTQGPGIHHGEHGGYLNGTANASELDEDEALAIATAPALYCHNVFSAVSAISANVIDIQQRSTELGSETV
jgi:hypothetical protein